MQRANGIRAIAAKGPCRVRYEADSINLRRAIRLDPVPQEVYVQSHALRNCLSCNASGGSERHAKVTLTETRFLGNADGKIDIQPQKAEACMIGPIGFPGWNAQAPNSSCSMQTAPSLSPRDIEQRRSLGDAFQRGSRDKGMIDARHRDWRMCKMYLMKTV